MSKNSNDQKKKPDKATQPPSDRSKQQTSDGRKHTVDCLPKRPVLRFSPTAWAKLLFMRDRGPTEIGGFGITDAEDLLYVRDIETISQEATCVSVELDDEAVADFFDAQVDAGRRPEQFARIWVHTHPGGSPQPSATDERTFGRVFGRCQWAVMFILARGGRSRAILRFNVGPGGQVAIPVEVDYSRAFEASDTEAWEQEYRANIADDTGLVDWAEDFLDEYCPDQTRQASQHCDEMFPDDWLAELEQMSPAERRLILEELAARDDLFGDTEVEYAL
ncbi:MAG: hypothetical protein ACP5HU_13550 [Phycisphaerae bacterium]